MDVDKRNHGDSLSIPKNNNISVKGLRKAFSISAIMGVILIFSVAFFGIGQIYSMFLSACIIGFYWLIYSQGNSPRKLRDIFSDSVYYLGFLLTVLTLIASMSAFGFSEQELSANNVLSQFGMAMVTTLMGLFIRVYYKQFDVSLHKVEDEAQETLENSIETVVIKMKIVTENLTVFSNTISDKISEMDNGCKDVAKIFDETAQIIRESSLENLESLSEGCSTKINESLEKIDQHSRQSLHELAATANEFTNIHRDFATDGISSLKQGIAEGFSATKDSLTETVADFRAQAKRINSSIGTVHNKFNALDSCVSSTITTLDTFKENTSPALSKLNQDATQTIELYNGLTQNLNVIGGKVREQLASIQEADKVTSQSLAKTIKEYEGLCKRLRDALQLKGLKELSEEDAFLIGALEERRAALENLNGAFNATSEELIQSAKRFSDNMLKTSKGIVDTLGDKDDDATRTF